MNPPSLIDEELLRIAQAEFDPLTGTELESELLSRMGRLIDDADQLSAVTTWMDDKSYEPHQLVALLKVLDEFNVDDIPGLRQKLERADKWYGIAEEAGDLFQRLQDLTNNTL